MKGGKIVPIAVIKSGKTVSYEEFVKGAAPEAPKPAAEPAKEEKK
jgi:hypothetical protein